jgi:hypothetical protein
MDTHPSYIIALRLSPFEFHDYVFDLRQLLSFETSSQDNTAKFTFIGGSFDTFTLSKNATDDVIIPQITDQSGFIPFIKLPNNQYINLMAVERAGVINNNIRLYIKNSKTCLVLPTGVDYEFLVSRMKSLAPV